MNKAFYIGGIVFSVIFFIVAGGYVAAVATTRIAEIFSSINSYNDPYAISYTSTYTDSAADLTAEAALISLFFFLYFLSMDVLGLVKVKTRTTKVLSIIGLSFSLLFLLWNLVMLASPGAVSFDEVGPAFMFYCTIMLAFSIIGLIQSVRYGKTAVKPVMTASSDLLDS